MLALGADEVQALETREVYSRVQLPLPAFLAGSKFRSDFDNDCRRVADLFVLNLKDGADIGKVLAFMKDSVNRTLMSDEEMSDGNLLMLWQDIAANTTSVLHDGFPMELQGPRLNCDKAYCKALPFAGNPDLGGIGVLSGTLIQATMSIIMVFMVLVRYWRPHRTEEELQRRRTNDWKGEPGMRIGAAFRDLVPCFLDSSAFYNLSLTIAGTILMCREKSSQYDISNAYFATTMSVFPYYSVRLIHGRITNRRRTKFHTIGTVMITVFAIAQTSLVIYKLQKKMQADRSDLSKWEGYCYVSTTFMNADVLPFFVAGCVALFLLGGLLIIFFVWLLRCCRRSRRQEPLPWSLTFSVSSVFSFGLSAVAYFTVKFSVWDSVGDSYEENKWGFGQWLALFAWAPVLAELLYIYFFGTMEALDGKLPWPYRIFFYDGPPRNGRGYITVRDDPTELGDIKRPVVQILREISSHSPPSQISTAYQPYERQPNA